MTSTSKNTKKPSHHAFQVREGANRQSYWTRIGAAWEIKDGLSIQLDCVPLDGRIVLQLPKREDDVKTGAAIQTA